MTLRWAIVPSGLDAAFTRGYCVSAERSGAFEGDLADEQAGVARAPARGRTGSRRDDHRRPGSPPPGTRQPDRAARAPRCRASARPRRPRNRCHRRGPQHVAAGRPELRDPVGGDVEHGSGHRAGRGPGMLRAHPGQLADQERVAARFRVYRLSLLRRGGLPGRGQRAATATGGSPVSAARSVFASAGSIRISSPLRSPGGAGSRQVARISIRTPRSWRTRCASSSSDGSSAHWMSSSTSSRPSGSAARASRSRTALNRAKRCPRSSSEPLPRSCPAVPPNASDHRSDPGLSLRRPSRPDRSCKASRHSPYGGAMSRSLERAQATAAPRAAASAAVSSASRVLPIPASPG